MIVCMRAGEHAHATGINYRPSCKHEHVLCPYRMTRTCNGAASAVGAKLLQQHDLGTLLLLSLLTL